MAHTVVALFGSLNTAQDAVKDLRAAGFRQDSISIIGNAGAHALEKDLAPPAAAGAGVGAASGALLGGAAGLLASLGVLAIPGIGPLLAAGPIAAMLTGFGAGAAVGAVAGGLVGVLTYAGIPEHEAHRYAEAVRAGGTLVTVDSDDARAAAAADIMKRCGAVDVGQHLAPRPEGTAAPDVAEPPPAPARAALTPGRHAGRTPEQDAADPDTEDYQRHYQASVARNGRPYQDYSRAYEYGARTAQELEGRDFDLAIGEVRQGWEANHPGTWDQYLDAIRYAWDRRRMGR